MSLEITEVKEADSVPKLEGNMCSVVFGEILSLFRGLSPRYDMTGKLQELGRPFKLLSTGETRNLPLATVHTHSVTREQVGWYKPINR